MSARMNVQDILHEYGLPLATLTITSSQEDCLKLRERLMTIRNLGQGKVQGCLEVACTLSIDIHDIDRFLSGKLTSLAEIYAFPENIKAYAEE